MGESLPPLAAEQIDAVLRFRPELEALEGPYTTWVENTGTFPYPNYAPMVTAFFRELGRSHWMDTGYHPNEAGQRLREPGGIESADIDELRTLITFVVRSERFADGSWGNFLQEGTIFKILDRLSALRADFTDE